MHLYLIRHGQSTNNALIDQKDRYYDPALTDLGRRQAELVAQHLASAITADEQVAARWSQNGGPTPGFGVTKLYCSPMLRTLQTAQPISAALGFAPEVWIDLHEHGGIFLDYEDERGVVGYPGLSRHEITTQFAGYILPETITDQGWWNPAAGMESLAACQSRAIHVASALYKQAATTERIALVTHGTFADSLIKALFSQLPGRRHFYYHYNTAITRIDFQTEGRLDLVYLNRVDHLPPELVS